MTLTADAATAMARESLAAYTRLHMPTFHRGRHHEALIKHLHAVMLGKITRLMIFMPPRSGKSLLTSQFFPAYYLGKFPQRYIIAASYSQDLASDFGTKVRNLISDPIHSTVFPESVMSDDSASKQRFTLTAGGAYFAVGVGGPITGRGAHCVAEGVPVRTREGDKPIERVVVGDEVRAYDHARKRVVWAKVQATSTRFHDGPVVELIARGGTQPILLTPDHRVFSSGAYLDAGDLKRGDELLRLRAASAASTPLVGVFRHHALVRVHDLQVEGTSNFFAGGVLVHNCLIIDDPIKDREDAYSEAARKALHDWYTFVAYTRLMPGGAVVLMNTRWHTDDLSGHLLEQEKEAAKKQGWVVLSLPALAEENDILGREPGEALWPEFYSQETLEATREAVGPQAWLSLYQQRPVTDEGSMFLRNWLKFYKKIEPREMNKYIVVDPANSKKKRSDKTAMGVFGLGPDRNYYLLDLVWDRLSLTERGDALFDLHRKWKPLGVGYEQYGLQADIAYIEERMERQNYRFNVIPLGGKVRKEERVAGLVPVFQGGRMWFPEKMHKVNIEGKERDLIDQFVEQEYATFPASRHDDVLDMMARILDEGLRVVWPAEDDEQDISASTTGHGSWMAA